jgi:hypothetical protein
MATHTFAQIDQAVDVMATNAKKLGLTHNSAQAVKINGATYAH